MREAKSTAGSGAPGAGGLRRSAARGARSRALAAAAAVIAAMLGLSHVHPFGNPRSVSSKGLGARLLAAGIPPAAKDFLVAKCADCHSNETRWPLYARLAPGSWLMEWDIVEGRKEMNLSLWDQLPPEGRESLVSKMIMEIKSGEMPPLQYLLLHWGARPTMTEVAALASLNSAASEASVAVAGDAVRGKQVFEKRCAGCHAMSGNREGPQLGGLLGRRAGSVAHFGYSPALKKSGLTWNEATLDKWLADPDTLVPDTTMDSRVRNAEERRDLIAYLRQ